ncbi:MAG: cob(I)yrinic acid a,c-diamide adenosyltransferase [Clostridia bacterium]
MKQLDKGLIHIYTGDGKGKTTAALGLAMRAAGSGLKVYMLQFLKSYGCGEHIAAQNILNLKIETVTDNVKFVFNMTNEEKLFNKEQNEKKFEQAIIQCKSGNIDLMIFDEIIGCINMKQLDEQKVLDFLKTKPQSLEIVMTGRDPSTQLMEYADYITEMKKIKHPFDKGANARKGIEF